MRITTFKELNYWKACRNLRLFIAKEVFPELPQNERYRLGDQILRAARSTTANIAEGYGRFHYMDNAKFCSHSRGSCWEVLDHLITAYDEEFISEGLMKQGEEYVSHAIRLINGYMNYLKKASKGNTNTFKEEPEEYYIPFSEE